MPLQDLTPQLRTRLSRVERAVGLFVTVATLLLLGGFAYYIYHTAERKGWFKTKIEYTTSLNNATGLKPGQSVKLMGFDIGELTQVEAEAPGSYYGVTVYFRVKEPYYGYIWLDSKVRVAPADFLGNRNLEVLKGWDGAPTVLEKNNEVIGVLNHEEVKKARNEIFQRMFRDVQKENPSFNQHTIEMEALLRLTNVLNQTIRKQPERFYVEPDKAKPYWIEPLESPALTDRLETVVNAVETALPNILDLTNKISAVLTNANEAASRLSTLLEAARPTMTNLAVITENLREPDGSLGKWLLPPDLLARLEETLKSADEVLKTADNTLENTDTNLTTLVFNLNKSLENLASITGNLNAQVQTNSNILGEISSAIVHTDELVQGLKRHWLLRSAFKEKKSDKDKKQQQAPAPRKK